MKKYSLIILSALLFIGCAINNKTARDLSSPMPPIPLITNSVPIGAVFYDPFNSGIATPWTFYQGSHLFVNGILRLNANPTNGAYAYIRSNWTDVSVSADVRLTNNSTVANAAVGLRYNATNGSSYQVCIYAVGRLSIERYDNWFNTHKELVSIGITPPSTNINNLKLSVVHNVLTAFLNGNQLISYTDSVPLIQGGICLSVRGSNAVCVSEFDNVIVSNLYAPPPNINPPIIINGLTNIVVLQGTNWMTSVLAANATGYAWTIPGRTTFYGTNIYTITNVQPASAGTYSVLITNATGWVYSSAHIAVGTTNVLDSTNRNVQLHWCPVLGPVIYYMVYYGVGTTTVTNWISDVYDTNTPCTPPVIHGTNWFRNYTYTNNAGNMLAVSIPNLIAGVTYYFAITAVYSNEFGIQLSNFSNEVRYTTPPYIIPYVTMGITDWGLNTFELSAKVCPYSLVSVQSRINLNSGGTWTTIATNMTPDAYGNFFYTCQSTNAQNFYRLQIQ